MLVYGDHEESADPRGCATKINRILDAVEQMAPGLERHQRLVDALIQSGQLLQGIADAQFARATCDRRTQADDELGDFLLKLARALCRSWDSDFKELGALPRIETGCWPQLIDVKLPEGFAFYALYPEAFIEAARRLQLTGPARVIGIRSIGTSLAALVAAALGSPPPISLRPVGDPFDRKVAIDPSLERELLEGEVHYVIVDEGPGQSGSSFGAVAAWLHAHGVLEDRIALVPSHNGAPGPAASPQRRRWWAEVQRQPADLNEDLPRLLELWSAPLLGKADEPLEDISGGAWRKLHYAHEEGWPAAVPTFERRKFLLRARGEPFLLKFAGLGAIGEQKLALAQKLCSEGLIPEPVGVVHGFLVERWCADAAPMADGDKPVAEIGRYIAMRARLLPAGCDSGASIDELIAMAWRNISLELGDEFARPLDWWSKRADELQRRIVRICTDNKLDRHEWLRTSKGALIKTDALDHHQAHDLVGCQDAAWDAVAAIVELDLAEVQSEELLCAIHRWSGRKLDRELLAFYHLAYLAFRLGQSRLSQTMVEDEFEQGRLRAKGDRYAAELQQLLESRWVATRPKSLVG